MNERGLKGRFWETYLRPSIDNFQSKLKALSPLEKNYFYAVYNFITKELYTSKSGDVDYEGRTGAASLWLSTLAEKCEAGEIIYDLKIKENHAADEHKAGLTFSFFKKEKAGKTLLNESAVNDITGDKAIGNDITGNEASASTVSYTHLRFIGVWHNWYRAKGLIN